MRPCQLGDWNLFFYDQRVLLRADLNVPLDKNGNILDDTRLKGAARTIDFLISYGAKIVLATHLGKPHNQEPELSTKNLMSWFIKEDHMIKFAETPQKARELIAKAQPYEIILLENLRFFRGEKDPLYSDDFARELALCGDYYINDAWGSMHRTDTSLIKVPRLFDEDHKTFGFLTDLELYELGENVRNNPKKPFVVILGGGKGHEKLHYLKHLCLNNPPTHLILLPGLSNTITAALGYNIGISPSEKDLFPLAQEILDLCKKNKTEVIVPQDYLIGKGGWNGPLSYTDSTTFPADGYAIGIGPKTVISLEKIVRESKVTFLNGIMGDLSRPETLRELGEMLRMITQSNAFNVIGGGDSIAALHIFDVPEGGVDFVSTGGGSTLAFISHSELPALNEVS